MRQVFVKSEEITIAEFDTWQYYECQATLNVVAKRVFKDIADHIEVQNRSIHVTFKEKLEGNKLAELGDEIKHLLNKIRDAREIQLLLQEIEAEEKASADE